MHHACECHVDESVDPQRSEEEEKLMADREAAVLLVVRTQRTEDEGDGLPETSHDDNPSIAL